MPYLAYDVRGIQSFLFAIPKLRSIIGGSALIDRFDRLTVPSLAKARGWNLVHSGGGRGLFGFRTPGEAEAITQALVDQSQRLGFDLRIGRADRVVDAAHCAEALYPFVPERLDGHPCALSGLYPVEHPDQVHEVVQRRHFDRGDLLDRWFESVVIEGREGEKPLELHPALNQPIRFFREIAGAEENGSEGGRSGLAALGGRRRWAIVCMDGNDIGRQFAAASKMLGNQEEKLLEWVRACGAAIDACGVRAFRAATDRVLRLWVGDVGSSGVPIDDGECVVPLRPLVLGGDDLTLLCHPRYAAEFAMEASRVFTQTSRERHRHFPGQLWPATDGQLTISAGILYAPTSLPLASAIPYAESLLAMAKRRGRERAKDGLAPACIDWESVTESMLDRPDLRRRREMVFRDMDLGGTEVHLTRRPYQFEELSELSKRSQKLEQVPASVLHRLLPGMRAGAWDRQVFVNRLSKNQPELAACLAEPAPTDMATQNAQPGSCWRQDRQGTKEIRTLDFLDVVGLALEQRREIREVNQ